VASVREQDRVRSREVARDTGDAFGPPVVPSSVIHAQGSLWGWVNGYALDPDLQDALAVWWYAHPHDGMDEVWRKIRTKEISDKDLRSTLEREVGSMGGTNMVWAVSPDGRRVAVNLSVSARGITVDVGTGTKRRTLSPARVVRVTREVLALPG
jgi:hypothetical protein